MRTINCRKEEPELQEISYEEVYNEEEVDEEELAFIVAWIDEFLKSGSANAR